MRWLPRAIPVLIAIIALDFALVFGFEAWRIFNSPVYGLDRLSFATLIHGIGGVAGLRPESLFNLAAFFGAVYLTTSGVFLLHLATRISALRGGRVSHDLLDAGLILVVVSTMVAATPAVLQGATDILIHERLPLWLVGLAATLSMIERVPEGDARPPAFVQGVWSWLAARRNRRDGRVVSPALRNSMPARRWDSLRNEAGMVVRSADAARPVGPWFSPQ